jgi:predicted transcriptional regulator
MAATFPGYPPVYVRYMKSLQFSNQSVFNLLFTIKVGLNNPTWIRNEIKPWKIISELLSNMMGSGLIECTNEKQNERFLRKQYHITTKGNQVYEDLMLTQGIVGYTTTDAGKD